MGLDMYLSAELYVGGYEHCPEQERGFYKELAKKCGITKHTSKSSPSAQISFTVAYWRKANHIHQWFVNNVQDGRDECQRSYVSREQLQELVSLCKKVLGVVECVEGDVSTGTTYRPDGEVIHHTKKGKVVCQKAIAEKLLPTAEGFFFGGTDYDEYYLKDTQDTIDMIEPLLLDKTMGNWSFYYQSSW